MSDLTYTQDGMFTRFIPVTTAGEDAWRTMAAESNGTPAFLNHLAKGVISQLRAAGYKVTKARPVKVSDKEIDNLLAQLTS